MHQTAAAEQRYLFGWEWLPWDGAFAAALVAGGVAALFSVLSHRLAKKSHKLAVDTQSEVIKLNGRQSFETRFLGAMELIKSDNPASVRAGALLTLEAVRRSEWATDDEKQIITGLFTAVEEEERRKMTPPEPNAGAAPNPGGDS